MFSSGLVSLLWWEWWFIPHPGLSLLVPPHPASFPLVTLMPGPAPPFLLLSSVVLPLHMDAGLLHPALNQLQAPCYCQGDKEPLTPLLEPLSWFPTAFNKTFLSGAHQPFTVSLPSTSLASSPACTPVICCIFQIHHTISDLQTYMHVTSSAQKCPSHMSFFTCYFFLIFSKKPSSDSSFSQEWSRHSAFGFVQVFLWDRTSHPAMPSQMELVLSPLNPNPLRAITKLTCYLRLLAQKLNTWCWLNTQEMDTTHPKNLPLLLCPYLSETCILAKTSLVRCCTFHNEICCLHLEHCFEFIS